MDALVDKLRKDIGEEVAYSDVVARDVVKKDVVAEAALHATLSDVGSQSQPVKGVDMTQSKISIGAAVMHPVGSEGDETSDVGNAMKDAGIPLEGSQSNIVDNSHSLVNKDWNHWAVLHGKEKDATEDVWEIGKALRLQFEGDVYNRFSVFSRAGKGKRGSKSCEEDERGSLADVGC